MFFYCYFSSLEKNKKQKKKHEVHGNFCVPDYHPPVIVFFFTRVFNCCCFFFLLSFVYKLFSTFFFSIVEKHWGYLQVTKKYKASLYAVLHHEKKILLDIRLSLLPHCVCFPSSDESHNLRRSRTTFLYYIRDN